MNTAVRRLNQLGFTDYEARAYTALLRENPASAYEIAKNSGIPSSKIYEVINKLIAKEIIQPIQGERSKMYLPLSPDELLQRQRSAMENTLQELKSAFQGVRSGLETGYTWHMKEYDNFMLRCRRMITTAQETILLLIWPREMDAVASDLLAARERGTRVAVVHYGTTDKKIPQLYLHPVEDSIYAERNTQGFTLVTDSKEVLTGRVDGDSVEAVWSMNRGLVMMAEDYIRHDVYFMKLAARFHPLLREKFGRRYEKLRDLFEDKSFP